jgi:hypothetical protein
MNLEMCLVNWALIPAFVKEAVVDFPFECTADAQMFSDLLVSRMRGILIGAPELDDEGATIEEFMNAIEAEFVCSATSDSLNADNRLVSWSEICRQMLLCQLPDQATRFLQRSLCNQAMRNEFAYRAKTAP